MPLKRSKSPIEEEALLTRPSTPSKHAALNGKPHPEDKYELESHSDAGMERQGLLTSERSTSNNGVTKTYRDREGDDDDDSLQEGSTSLGSRKSSVGSTRRKRRRIGALAAVSVSVILLGGIFARPFLFDKPPSSKHSDSYDPDIRLWNGTHEYQKTVLLVSIDGLRADYLDRGLTPHLLHISKRGLRAQWMKPAFPSLTFPNHWSLMTGLYPESHGIVGNNFYDPSLDAEFVYTDPKRSHDGKWWGGEPMWETAAKAGLNTAVMMWPGPPTTSRGVSPTYFIEFNDDTKLFEKVSRIIEWLEMPQQQRPRLITVYEPSLDEAGHLAGPGSPLVQTVLEKVDVFAKDIHQALIDRNLTHIVDVIYVSDHGMTDTSGSRIVYLDDIIGKEGVNEIIHEDGWPNFGLRFAPTANVSHYLSVLQQYSASHHPDSPFAVYTPETMPKRYHFSHNQRISPIYLCPRLGWVLSNTHGETGRPKGTHGYDNDEPDMRAMFVADGPFAKRANPRRLSRRAGDALIPGFANLELYGLVTKILGLTPAPNNGTQGFWDEYF
ncbi:hypothetical protein FRC20_005847 [Serendipita sp. 405]|nr:hypothetical protein FRC20_005847 [Serendipita sp. 405]